MKKIYNDCRSIILRNSFAQNTKPQLEAVGNQVKATTIMKWKVQQQGHYLNGKLQGEWIL
jgi:hypothetical protein